MPRWSAATPLPAGTGPLAPPPAPRSEISRFVAPTPEQLHPSVRVKKRTRLRFVVYALVVGALAGGGLYGYRVVREANDAVPSPIAFVHGAGVPYTPAGQGFTIRLPQPPTNVVSHTTTDGKLTVRLSELRYDKYEISVASYNVAGPVPAAETDFELRTLLAIWAGKGTRILKTARVVDHGRAALDATGRVPDRYPVRIHVVLGSHHLVLLAVHADNGNTNVYRALVSSLRLK